MIDGTGLVYKAYYGIKELNTSSGQPVNALYGLARMLTKLLKEHIQEGHYVTFFMDKGRTTFRTLLMDEYKAQRPPMPDALREQMKEVAPLVEGFGIPVLSMEGFEADDLIATYVREFRNDCDEIWILTSDKDLCQLIDGKVKMLRAEKGITDLAVYDEEKVREKYGVTPIQMIDYLSIVGDKVDNIPGVRGIGEKGALQLLSQYPTLEAIYDHIEHVPEKLRAKLAEGRADAFLSKQLVTLKADIRVSQDFEALRYRSANTNLLLKSFHRYEFRSLEREWMPTLFNGNESVADEKERGLTGSAEDQREAPHLIQEERNYVVVDDEKRFREVLDAMKNSAQCAFDTETDSLNTRDARLVGISVSMAEKHGFYLPVAHDEGPNLPESLVAEFFETLRSVKVIGHNLKYDFEVVAHNGYPLPERYFDTMIAAYLLDPDRPRFNLDGLASVVTSQAPLSYKDLMGSHPFSRDFSQIPIAEAARYSIEDADLSLRLYHRYVTELKEYGLDQLFERIEMPLLKVLVEMETIGVYFDRAELLALSERMDTQIKQLKQEVMIMAGETFNLDSPIQLGKVLFEKMGLPSKKNTSKSKNYSTDKSVLEELAADYDIAGKILEYRKLNKLKTTYIDAIPTLIHPKTHRVHTSFNQTGTATGRLSSSEPNLQNLPVKNEEGKEIRAAIKPQKAGWLLLSADYSQIELRIMAYLSQDENLLEAFRRSQDIHTYTASRLFGVPLSNVDRTQRRIGKMINFSIIYGVSSFGLSSRLGIRRKDAERFIEAYFQAYPGIKGYMNAAIAFAQSEEAVRTLYGRLRKIRFISSRNQGLRKEAERVAINSPVQGTAADVIKIAMIRIHERLKREGLQARLILQIHDELVFELPESETSVLRELVAQEMEQVLVSEPYASYGADARGAAGIPLLKDLALKVDIEVSEHY
ncbi:MAG TPA: DNA polymerase I [Thermotogota bacterium]|nr:DNA polymerase I [Thermotogota bacterium]HPH10550.1 DNA polymerase I [Thermotogota bacterium]